MALLFVLDTEGRDHLVHSSIFDSLKVVDLGEDEPKRPARATGDWLTVWGRFEANRPKRVAP